MKMITYNKRMAAQSKLLNPINEEDIVDITYKNGKIYLVKCKYDDELVYVGSTYQSLEDRMSSHKNDKNCSLYQYVDGDWDNWNIELYEDYPCKNKYELERRETEVQRQIATINKQLARRTSQEYYQDNRDKLLEQNKQYYQDNRDKIIEYQKQYQQDNRDKIVERKKQFYQDNREKIAERDKQYYQNNRDKIAERKKQKITCERCGCIVRKGEFKRHHRSQKCLNYNVGNN